MHNSDVEKFEFVLENISNIEKIIQRKSSLTKALSDKIESRPAILMALLQIGESLNKIKNSYEEISNDDIKGSYEVRNFIAHDYMGVDIGLVEFIIRDKLPKLKDAIKKTLKQHLL